MKLSLYNWVGKFHPPKNTLNNKGFSGWWFQPLLKNISQNGNLPQIGMKIKQISETTNLVFAVLKSCHALMFTPIYSSLLQS